MPLRKYQLKKYSPSQNPSEIPSLINTKKNRFWPEFPQIIITEKNQLNAINTKNYLVFFFNQS